MIYTQMKKIINNLILTLMFLFSITCISYAEGNYYNKDVKVEGGSYGSIVSSEYENLTLEFDYKWITENSNTVYNNKLARAAILLASNAYSDVYVTTSDTPDASDKKSVLRELGIDDADIVYELYNEDNYDINTEDKGLDINDIAGITMGYKLITIGDNTYNTFIFIPDSTEGLAEWESNFDIGAGDGKDTDDYTILTGKHPDWIRHYNHKGFDVTATREKRIIDKFINDKNNPSYPTSILVCGHSRGGAVSNILSTLLVDENKYKVYAYTFGTPNTVEVNNKNNIKIENYKQIFNHVNKDDFVTNMPSDAWGFNKYGITLSMKVSNYDEVKLLYDALVSKDSEVVDAPNIPSTYAAPNIETTWDGNTKNIGVKETISNIATKRDDFYKMQTRTITYTGDTDTKNNLINHRKGENDTILDDLDAVKTYAGVKVPYNGLYAYEVIEDGIMEHYRQAILLRGMACILAKRSDILSSGFMLLGLEYIEDTHSKFMGDENETNTLITFSKENPSKKFNDFLEQILNNANTLGVPHTTASYYAMTTLRDINDMKINYNDTYNYTGEEIKPDVNVNDITSWEEHDDYEITYSNNIEVGTGLISINSLIDQFNLQDTSSALITKTSLQEDTKSFINNLVYKLIGNRTENFYIDNLYGSGKSNSSKKTYSVISNNTNTNANENNNKGDIQFDLTKAKKGTKVKVTIKPKEGYAVKEIIITDKNGNKIDNKNIGDNNFEFIMPSSNVNIEAIYEETKINNENENITEIKIANSNTGEKINKDVKFIQGYEDGSFKPENKVSNIELMCMVTSLFENVDLKDSKINLTQGNDFWGEDIIKKANILNLIPGNINDKNYDVNNKVTRYDLALVIYNLIGDKEKENKLEKDNNCNDIIGTNYEEAVTKLINLGIIRGYEDGLFHGDNELSRAEAVVIINRTLQSLGINKISNNFKSYFNDLDITHWAYDEIMRAAN